MLKGLTTLVLIIVLFGDAVTHGASLICGTECSMKMNGHACCQMKRTHSASSKALANGSCCGLNCKQANGLFVPINTTERLKSESRVVVRPHPAVSLNTLILSTSSSLRLSKKVLLTYSNPLYLRILVLLI